jgi:hypothetical protein
MTPKEKAREIVIKMQYQKEPLMFEQAKKCALLVVDEMTSQMLSLMKVFNEDRSEFEAIELDYLTRVKEEIEKL